MKKLISNSLFSIISLLLVLGLQSCSNSEQVSGVIGTVKYSTTACVAQEKLVRVRNENTSEAQRVIGIQIEPGTNEDKFFKLISIKIDDQEETAIANVVPDIIIPPGGVMDIKVSYNPKAVTLGDDYHVSYLDVILGNPLVGMQQFALMGQALTAKPNCGSTQGEERVFTLTKITVEIRDKDIGDPLIQNPAVDPDASILRLFVNDETAIVSKDNFPNIPIDANGQPVTGDLPAGEEFEGVFDGANINFEGITLSGSGVVDVVGTLTTGTSSATGADASLELTGSPLSNGKMTLVFTGKFPDNELLEELNGGVIGATLEFDEGQ